MLLADGYDADGIDPNAPDEPHYRRLEFEQVELPRPVDAFVASTSLHHVHDPAHVIDRMTGALSESGVVVVVEWAWEAFDTETALWCFERLAPDGEPGWLDRRREEWLASGREWPSFLREWAEGHGLHPGETVVRLLDERDIALDDISLRRPSLDEVFLNLTGQALSSTESDGSDVSDAARTDTAVRSRQELR